MLGFLSFSFLILRLNFWTPGFICYFHWFQSKRNYWGNRWAWALGNTLVVLSRSIPPDRTISYWLVSTQTRTMSSPTDTVDISYGIYKTLMNQYRFSNRFLLKLDFCFLPFKLTLTDRTNRCSKGQPILSVAKVIPVTRPYKKLLFPQTLPVSCNLSIHLKPHCNQSLWIQTFSNSYWTWYSSV